MDSTYDMNEIFQENCKKILSIFLFSQWVKNEAFNK